MKIYFLFIIALIPIAGLMISPQSIAVATAATALTGAEGEIFNKTLKFCIGYVFVLGILVYIGSFFI